MAKTVSINARIDPSLKEDAEKILEKIGIAPSAVISLLYKQIVLQRGLPFDLKLPEVEPRFLSEEKFKEELEKGISDMDNGNSIPTVKVFSAVK